MLAGVGPVPAALFVVAADGGWMPQSTEHLDALDALGVRHGVLAVTRSDLADPAPALAAARERLARTSLGGSVPMETIERLTNVGLEVRPREGSGFDLKLDLPEAAGASDEQRERLKKDNEQLDKVIANSLRQLGNENFVAKAPAHVIDGMRAKLAEYQAQLAKNRAALSE